MPTWLDAHGFSNWTKLVWAKGHIMSAKTVLAEIGADVKKAVEWIVANAKTIQAVETEVVDVYPPATGLVAIANAALVAIVQIEALANVAGSGVMTSDVKSAMLQAQLKPLIIMYAQQNNFPKPTAQNIKVATDALVLYANALDAKS